MKRRVFGFVGALLFVSAAMFSSPSPIPPYLACNEGDPCTTNADCGYPPCYCNKTAGECRTGSDEG